MATKIVKDICGEINLDFDNLLVTETKSGMIFVERYNWPYLDALKFQEACVDYVYKNPAISIIISTNHPACLTVGRGLQKKIGDKTQLVDFSNWQREQINIPIYDIKRGGGMTFHHPGQLVIYPVVNLTKHKIKVYWLMNNLLKELSEVLCELYGPAEFDYCRDLLGLWVNSAKLASIGLQVRRFVTFHGLALNVHENETINTSLQSIYPCGLPGETYKSLRSIYTDSDQPLVVEEIFSRMKKRLELILEENMTCQKSDLEIS